MLTRIGAEQSMGPKKPALSPVAVPTIPGQTFNLDRVVTEAEAASIIGYSRDTLRREFRAGRAPVRVRLSGRRIGYRLSAIYAFLEARTEQPGKRAET
jgi:predicted DNA-binding transcriptional regulator AlpA